MATTTRDPRHQTAYHVALAKLVSSSTKVLSHPGPKIGNKLIRMHECILARLTIEWWQSPSSLLPRIGGLEQ